MNNKLAGALLAATLSIASTAHAGTIVNISGASPDADHQGSGVDNPDAAVGTSVHFTYAVQLQLAAGDYSIRDAWGMKGATYDAWDFENGADGSWTDHFSVGAYIDGQSNYATYTLLMDGLPGTGSGHHGGFGSEADASNAFLASPAFTLHLDQDTLVGFAAPDYDLWDNTGGVSLYVERVGSPSAVPEPANVLMMLAGLGGLAGLARRRARAATRGA